MDSANADEIITTEQEENAPATDLETAAEEETAAPSFSDDVNEDEDYYEAKIRKKRKRKKIITVAILSAAVLLVGGLIVKGLLSGGEEEEEMYIDVAAERRTIMNTITGSSYIEPNDSYNVNSMHSGDITADYVSEGATVKKGDKLYQFDDEDARSQLTNAQNSLTKAQQQYEDAVKTKSQTISSNNAQTQSARNAVEKALTSLNDARDALNDRNVISEADGKVSEVFVKNGDTLQNGAKIIDIYDDSVMKLRLPFNEIDAENLYTGAAAEVSIAGTNDTAWGTVTEIAAASTATETHSIVVYATIELSNPGALTPADTGSAVVNGAACADTANFEYKNTSTVTASAAGTLQDFNIEIGDWVYDGEQIAYVDSDQLQSSYDNAQLSYDDALLSLERQILNNDTYSQDSAIKNAQLSLDDARVQLKNAQDTVDDFVVEAPIDGTVVTKNAKAGDTIDSSNGSSEPLCVIYDLSSVKFSLDVDETEVALVHKGQKVTVTADAVEGEYEGEVIKVPVDGVNQNGVTTYTIDVEIKEYGDLLPGMNVDAEIVVQEADNVVTIPVNSVNRGDVVFVKDDGMPHENDITALLPKEEDESKKKKNKKEDGDDQAEGTAAPSGMPHGAVPAGGAPESGIPDNIPKNIEVPEGYLAISVETGINDSDYIEIKSGIKEGDMIRTLNTIVSSEGALDDDMSEAMGSAMGGGPGGMGGNPGGGRGGGPGGGPR